MGLTEQQRAERYKNLGASDVAAIMGFGHYLNQEGAVVETKNAYDIWLEKTRRVVPEKDRAVASAGNRYENAVLDFAEEILGPLERDPEKLEIRWEGFPIVVHCDARVIKTGECVEAKTAGLYGPLLRQEWGDQKDAVPDRIIIQCHVQMGATNTKVCHVPALLGGRGEKMYVVERDDLILNDISDAILQFWQCVEEDTAPVDIIPTLSFSKRIRREPKKTINFWEQIQKADPTLSEHECKEEADGVIANWLNAKESLKIAQKIADGSQAEVLSLLGDAEAGICTQGTVTYFEQESRRLNQNRLREEKPEIVVEYTELSAFRVLRLKKAKKEKPKRQRKKVPSKVKETT